VLEVACAGQVLESQDDPDLDLSAGTKKALELILIDAIPFSEITSIMKESKRCKEVTNVELPTSHTFLDLSEVLCVSPILCRRYLQNW